MVPLLALGLLAGNALANDYVDKSRREKLSEGLGGLLGKPEGARAGDEGPVQVPGSGLLADPSDIQKQMQFAQGLMGLPGGATALQSFAPLLNQAIQSKQWTAGQAQQADQYGRTEQRLVDQFAQTKDWQQQEADRLQSNWKAQFEQQAAQQAFQRQMEGARLQLSRQSEARQAAADKVGSSKLPSGYGVVDTATGVSLAPMKGTENYAKAVGAEGAIVNAMGAIDSLMDQYLGKEVETRGGNVVRRGGVGSETWGPAAAEMAGKRGGLLAALGQAREMGVLDKNEYDRLTQQLPETGEWFRGRGSWEAAYKEIRSQFAGKLKTHRAANPWLVPPPPPGYK
jgi:hypothetical protein